MVKGIKMKRGSTHFLRLAGLAVGTIVLALCIFALPATWQAVPREYPNHTYVFYSILLAMYVAAIPFFIALWHAFKLLDYVDKAKAFSMLSVKALMKIVYCGIAISVAYAASVPFFYIWAENDDAPGLILISLVLTLAPLTVSVFAGVLARLFKEAVHIKSENDFTV